ncbi:MAG TPA: DNA-directed DNA polymerase II small subunit [archaeon]|nr:DNA-directed DNA polymerase II small subunit [archaeon]
MNAKSSQIINYVSEKNAIINQNAVQLLSGVENFESVLDRILETNFIVDEKQVEKYLVEETKLIKKEKKEFNEKGKEFNAKAENIEADFRILDEFDVTGKSSSEGKVENFLEFFHDKFNFLKTSFDNRSGFNPKPLKRLNAFQKGDELDFIGMVFEKRKTKNGHLTFKIEDLEGEVTVLVLKDDEKLLIEAQRILLDDVIGFKGVKGNNDFIILKEFMFPDFPLRQQKKGKRELNLCITSDIHIGSKLFLQKQFERFIEWINGRIGDEKEIEKVGKIKYLIIAGDLVDGIGVYPEQINELSVADINEQYNIFIEYIKQIPKHIEIFIAPGNHDAVRRADPQPALPREFLKELYDMPNVHMIGSPSMIEIEELKVFVYHGCSLHDLYSSLTGLDSKKPEKAIIEALKRRSVGFTFGLRQPYVPEKKDFNVLREIPDIYIGGDMHHNGYGTYRGCLIVNNGTWQDQTEFQTKMGHVATPGIVPVIELNSMKIIENYFYKKED